MIIPTLLALPVEFFIVHMLFHPLKKNSLIAQRDLQSFDFTCTKIKKIRHQM